MRRYLIILSVGMICSNPSFSQLKKHFSLDEDNNFNRVNFSFSLPSGTCYISPKNEASLLNIYSTKELENYNSNITKWVDNKTCHVKLNLEAKEKDSYSESVSYKLFNKTEKLEDQVWKIYLSDKMPYSLDLNYGIGDAYVDLSGVAISKLKIHTGSADVNVGFLSGVENLVVMDSFYVKVDLGTLNIRRLDLSKAKTINADVGFGSLYMDFSEGSKIRSNVSASVGAGDLIIRVPSEKVPVIVNVNSSLLCRVKLGPNFEEIKDNVYINDLYHPDAENLITFNVDVSLGSISFKTK